ncbi:unnamed protein product [Calicophoron daubneyi]|uniref:J domain-containing protein n=1 Tax=Calicophoron daubneyi TaxID=300641 RepID=A0AAV2TX64_CALDB
MRWLPLVIFACLFLAAYSDTDYYKILNVDKKATRKEIKKSYRNLAKKYHPDTNKNDPEAEEKFRQLSEAYEVLNDQEKRDIYDRQGKEGLKQHGVHRGAHPFADFFGFHFDFGQSDSQEALRGDDVTMDLWVTLEELYSGEFVEFTRVKMDKKNAKGTRKCKCRNEMQTTMLGPGQFSMRQVEVCDECPNVELFQDERMIEIEIEPGMADGYIYPFRSEGELHLDGEPGDLNFRIRQQKHRVFHRRGDDLYTNITLSLAESVVGYNLILTHLDGHQVHLESTEMTPPGTVIRKPGEGMPRRENPKARGTLYITVDVHYPTDKHLVDSERAQLFSLLSNHSAPSDGSFTSKKSPAQVYNGLDLILQLHGQKIRA